jgi:hypothetical protein
MAEQRATIRRIRDGRLKAGLDSTADKQGGRADNLGYCGKHRLAVEHRAGCYSPERRERPHQLGLHAVAPIGTLAGSRTHRLPFAESAKDVLKSALAEPVGLGHNYIGTEHLLLGLYHDPEDPAAKALVALGATYDDIKVGIAQAFADLSTG